MGKQGCKHTVHMGHRMAQKREGQWKESEQRNRHQFASFGCVVVEASYGTSANGKYGALVRMQGFLCAWR